MGRILKYDGEKWITKGWIDLGQEGGKANKLFFDKSDHLWIASDWSGAYEIIEGDISSVDDENIEHSLLIYPNPARDFITIQIQPSEGFEPSEGYRVQIFDMLGIEIMSELIHPMTDSHRMNVEKLSAGVYFIRIGDRVEKFVKMKSK